MSPPCGKNTSFGISRAFVLLSPSQRQVAYALLTRLPLGLSKASFQSTPFDLHVLSTPPAFVLSQDQTLHQIWKAFLALFSFRSLPAAAGRAKELPIAYVFITNRCLREGFRLPQHLADLTSVA